MKLSGFSSVYNGPKSGLFPPIKRDTGTDFWGEVKSAISAASTEKLRDSLECSNNDINLKALYDHLTPTSRDLLERVAAAKTDIKKDEWLRFCKELKDMGIITEYDFSSVRPDFHFIPIGYYDENGNIVTYEACPIMRYELEKHSNSAVAGAESWVSANNWAGDPLEYLDTWVSELYSWRSDLAKMRAEDGSPKYNNFTPITNRINSCQKVIELVKDLNKI